MHIQNTESYILYFYENYVIAEGKENAYIDASATEYIVKKMLKYYGGKNFTLITHRKNNYILSKDAYSPRIIKKIQGIAVVSSNPSVKANAFYEQLQFANSFAFFENLEDAKNWAESVTHV